MKAIWNGQVLAESNDTVIVEGNHYFPADSLDMQFFTDSSHTSLCPWKGTASYYSIIVEGQENSNAAWYYPNPSAAAADQGPRGVLARRLSGGMRERRKIPRAPRGGFLVWASSLLCGQQDPLRSRT